MKLKKITALALAVVMVLALLAGCEKPMDAQTLAQKMDEAAKGQNSVAGKMNLAMDMTMGVTGMSFDLGIDAIVDVKAAMEPLSVYADMDLTMEILGQSETTEMEMYMAEEEGKLVSYTYSGIDDSWLKEETDEIPEITAAETTMSEIPAENMTLAEEQQTIGEKSCYVLTVNMTGDLLNGYMDTYMGEMTTGLDEETAAMMEGLDFSALTANVVYYVDAETFLPLQMDMELLGFGEMMNGVLGEAFAEAMMGVGGEEMEITFDIPTCTVSITDISYDAVEVPTVPEEGVEAAALNPLQDDGSYVLRLEEDAMRVVLPEGYEGMVVDSQTLAVYNGDYTVNAMYAYDAEMTGEDLKLSCEEEIAYYQSEEGYYVSHAYGEFNGFTTVILRLSDGSAIYYAWKDVTGGVFYVAINAYGPLDTPDVFLECVSAFEG